MEYEQIQKLIGEVLDSSERRCLEVYNKIAFEKDTEIDTALDYFGIESTGSRSEKIILLDNLISKAHERAVMFSPAGLTILDILARKDSKLGRVYCYES